MATKKQTGKGSRRAMYEILPAGARGVLLKRTGKKGESLGFHKDNAAAVAKIRALNPRAANPAELILFGNPLPAAIVEGMKAAAGSKMFDAITGKGRKRLRRGKGKGKKKNPRGHKRAMTSLSLAEAQNRLKRIREDMSNRATAERRRLEAYIVKLQASAKNPDEDDDGDLDDAGELFQKFHGRAPKEVFELHQSAKRRRDFTILGPLVALGINPEKFDDIDPDPEQVVQDWDKLPHLLFLGDKQADRVSEILGDPKQYVKDVSLLASSPNGKQLYLISESPIEMSFAQFETDTNKDLVDLGDSTFVVYIAAKPRDVHQFVHTFGEEGGDRPRLVFDKLTKQILFVGGSYRVEAPGIIN